MPPQPPTAPFFTGHVHRAAAAHAVDGAHAAMTTDVTDTPNAATFDAWPDQPLLVSMEAGGIAWPSSCRNGTCRTCMGQVTAATAAHVRHVVPWPGLSADELAEGFILPCVAHPLGDVHLRVAS